MLTAAEQEQIIKANNEAFEELALRWREPKTGETEPDLRKAVLKMVCDYFSVLGFSFAGDDLYSLISRLQKAALGQDHPLELTEKAISIETRAELKNLYADPDPGRWDWDESQWDWELSLRDAADENVEWGYVAVIPLKNGRRFRYKIEPPFSHDEWAIAFVGATFACPTIHVIGELEEAKRELDQLLRADTPPLPSAREDDPQASVDAADSIQLGDLWKAKTYVDAIMDRNGGTVVSVELCEYVIKGIEGGWIKNPSGWPARVRGESMRRRFSDLTGKGA